MFEGFDEGQQVGRTRGTLRQDMEVIGHQAISAQGEGGFGRSFAENSESPAGQTGRAEVRNSVVGADSYEIRAKTEVVVFGQANGFMEAFRNRAGRHDYYQSVSIR